MPKKKKLKKDPAAMMQSFSKNLLGLKFMQRAQKAEKAASEDDDDEEIFSKLKNKQQCVIHPSYQFCERLKFGRLSFKGMNMEIESLMYNGEDDNNKWSSSAGNNDKNSIKTGQKRPAGEESDDLEDELM